MSNVPFDQGDADNSDQQISPAIIRQAALDMLATRSRSATICPSEVARSLASQEGAHCGATDWRSLMPDVHDAVDALVAEGTFSLCWKGKPMATRSGPYRVGWNTDSSAR